ncbi:MAG: ABC transporter permease [Caldilineaceae bacterium SB0666_bin_21]|nr:ABC transporter permease [Caldilineaceae bacterium SB0665_bin_21]MXZ43247.1 ABC transporter permease [Caldilineaceae bacterium SB0666_bin_21]MYA05126.1 ABC transporter permease [Caldilineaceae bacterium SB0664_bin_22]MYC61520.1 ABC transporter permease [Caldilineaceae bacterium SB0661_bin_34]
MTTYLASRLLQMVPSLFLLTVVLFALMRLGGDPVMHLAHPEASPEEIAEIRAAYGFDRPLPEQYLKQLRMMLRGDFGESFRFRSPALPLVIEKLPATMELAAVSMLVALLIAIPAGLLSAIFQNSPLDLGVTTTSTLGRAMPNFWIGIMLILLFAVHLGWLPVSGRLEATSIILPALTLGTSVATSLARILRSSMLEVIRQEYMTTAKAKGLHRWAVVLGHGLRNALIPFITVFGLQMAWLLGGSVIVEEVFAWPGMGRLLLNSVKVRDLSVVMAGVCVFALVVMGTNLLVDFLYTALDPRIRYSSS